MFLNLSVSHSVHGGMSTQGGVSVESGVSAQGGVCPGGCTPPEMTIEVGGTHPTGMHSCSLMETRLNYTYQLLKSF